MGSASATSIALPRFERNFWDAPFRCTQIATGSLGGKANGLVSLRDHLQGEIGPFAGAAVNVPTMAVLATDGFDEFISRNRLGELPFEELPDDRIAHAFQNAELPAELLGDLRALSMQVKTPLAIRSSSLLEDALERPFAGVYTTKMLPNNQADPDARFRRLVEAIKLVYASTYFRKARDYVRGTHPGEEKMAVIIQEVVGQRRRERFYPEISGVARSYNFYPIAPARPEDGVVSLALGLGKTIVDGGIVWTFSPAYPRRPLPFNSVQAMLCGTQTEFWAVNMGKAPAYDPIRETEYLVRSSVTDAEQDEALRYLASTYDRERDSVVPGLGPRGPRIVNFAPLLVLQEFPLNELLQAVLRGVEKATGAKVEIEFALTLQERRGERPQVRLGLLQVRPLAISDQLVEVSAEELLSPNAVVAGDRVMGNGAWDDIEDIVFVRPEHFSPLHTETIASQVESRNRELQQQRRPYVLIGFGRWGSSYSSLGIPVEWSQISGARIIVESTLPEMEVEFSQGSHFFHNLTSFRASYFMVPHDRQPGINWAWLGKQPVVAETEFIRHVRARGKLQVRVDGRSGRGIVLPPVAGNEAQG